MPWRPSTANFYFDYGHYLNRVTLGIDVARVPGLFIGDPISHIGRVFMTDVVLPNGRRVRWDGLNKPKGPGVTAAYNGGADVGQGEERYINTYWLVFERNGRSHA